MTSSTAPNFEAPEPGVVPAPADSAIEIRLLTVADDMALVGQVFRQVWGSADELIRLEMLMAISHAGGYVAAAFDTDRRSDQHPNGLIVGASVALLATHVGRPALHSHVTGILPGARNSGLGRALKLHQQSWARARDIEWIVWTFDPLVRRNAWFNIAILGAEVHEYLPGFYGTMTDGINAGDDSDRLLVAWSTAHDTTVHPIRDGSNLASPALVPTPADIVSMRRTDPGAVAAWRAENRAALTEALDAGRSIVGFTRDGDYVISS